MEPKISKDILVNKLLIECEKGNVLHQEMLYKHFYGYALTICRLYSYSNDEAVSILNDSFLKIFEAIQKKQYNKDLSFKGWLRKILINTAIDYYRKNFKHNNHLDINDVVYIETDETNAISNLQAEDILNLLDKLPELHRIVFNLYEIQGYSHQEIAEQLSIAESTSRVFLTRAKTKLRVLINKNF
ncbi:RNA polymerase sigma factor [Lutibacter sp.]|uniref:RNA polymerase sigma factor n=1 Tax=Lutibacter sp. TaxID=1925666 RepID=UPI001A1DC56D|nr:RNA polymerase sigma factor [Lutibacter sp.]MBI9042283.1 RNA polymerase sigma factor [Lutibacter sp.]